MDDLFEYDRLTGMRCTLPYDYVITSGTKVIMSTHVNLSFSVLGTGADGHRARQTDEELREDACFQT
jgi:hypothetical protein